VKHSKKFDPFAEIFGDLSERFQGDRWQPAVDVFETETAVVVRFEIAGVRKANLRVTVDGDLLRVSGVRKPKAEGDVRRLHQMEIAFGPFERSVRIEIPFDSSGVSAHLEDGFLRITLRKQSDEPHNIEVTGD
jgi:HSP20 family protein